jgi:DNA transformation protein
MHGTYGPYAGLERPLIMKPIESLPNVGQKLAEELKMIRINSWEDMINLGSVEIALMLKLNGIDVCCCKLYAIEGAIQGKRWHLLSTETRDRLKQEFHRNL